jgi:hypothetical protein
MNIDPEQLIVETLIEQAREAVFEPYAEWDDFIEEVRKQIDALREERTRRIFERANAMPETWRRHLVRKVMIRTFGPTA